MTIRINKDDEIHSKIALVNETSLTKLDRPSVRDDVYLKNAKEPLNFVDAREFGF